MIALTGVDFLMGAEDDAGFPLDGEGPVRRETLSPFFVDPYPTSNAEFARFVEAMS